MGVWISSLRESLEVSVKHSCQEGGGVTLWPLPFTLKSILRQKKNYVTMQKYNLQNIL
jgi:hypothetical protein